MKYAPITLFLLVLGCTDQTTSIITHPSGYDMDDPAICELSMEYMKHRADKHKEPVEEMCPEVVIEDPCSEE